MAGSEENNFVPGDEWIADSSSAHCMVCTRPFTLRRRRHHVRARRLNAERSVVIPC
jgi:hypothetical protein